MAESGEKLDDLQLKKRARRRLVGAVAFASVAAVVLPMVMDQTPPPAGHDIEIRIPDQEPVAVRAPAAADSHAAPEAATPEAEPASSSAAPGIAEPTPPVSAPAPAKAVAAAPAAETEKPVVEPAKAPVAVAKAEPAKPPATKAAIVEAPKGEAPKVPATDSKRAQSILENQPPAASDGGGHVVLIGAFANAANVKTLQTKLGQLGIKTYTETLNSPQGSKTRLRAGPFPNRDAADKALEKMKRIGVAGVVSAKN